MVMEGEMMVRVIMNLDNNYDDVVVSKVGLFVVWEVRMEL